MRNEIGKISLEKPVTIQLFKFFKKKPNYTATAHTLISVGIQDFPVT